MAVVASAGCEPRDGTPGKSEFGETRLVVKEFGPRGRLDALLLRHLRPMPGARYPAVAAAIRAAGVLTPSIERVRDCGDRWSPGTLIVTGEVRGARRLAEVLAGGDEAERTAAVARTARAAAALHAVGVFHFDLNEDNVIFGPGEDLEPILVDLDYAMLAKPSRQWLCALLARLDLHLLFTSTRLPLTPGDLARFERAYSEARCDRRARAGVRFARSHAPRTPRCAMAIHALRGLLLVMRQVR